MSVSELASGCEVQFIDDPVHVCVTVVDINTAARLCMWLWF